MNINTNRCRICLKQSDEEMKSITSKWNGSIEYWQMLNDFMTTELVDNGAPISICYPCELNLITAYSFKILCMETEKILRNLNLYQNIVPTQELSLSPSPMSPSATLPPLSPSATLTPLSPSATLPSLSPSVTLSPTSPSSTLSLSSSHEPIHLLDDPLQCTWLKIERILDEKCSETESIDVKIEAIKAEELNNELIEMDSSIDQLSSMIDDETTHSAAKKAARRNSALCRKCNIRFNKFNDYLYHYNRTHRKRNNISRPPPKLATSIDDCNIPTQSAANSPISYEQTEMNEEHLFDSEWNPELLDSNLISTKSPTNSPHREEYLDVTNNLTTTALDIQEIIPAINTDDHLSPSSEQVNNVEIKKYPRLTNTTYCRPCDIKFVKAREYQIHYDKVHRANSVCRKCNIKFIVYRDYQHHYNTMHRGRKSRYPVGSRAPPKNNVNNVARKDVQTTAESNSEEEMTFLMDDGDSANPSTTFNSNIKAKTKQKRIHTTTYCRSCDITFITNREYQIHYHHVHRTANLCRVCNITFAVYKDYYRHYNKYHRPKTLCPICGKLIGHLNMDDHLSTHSNRREYKCTECPKTFNLPGIMKTHYEHVHARLKRYNCPHCDRNFKYASTRNFHVASVHIGDRKYECHLCHLKFVGKGTLTKHLKRHEDLLMIKTSDGTILTTDSTLSEQSVVVGGVERKCNVCNKICKNIQALRAHKRIHKKDHESKEDDF